MSQTIPDVVIAADEAHHRILETVAFSRHLNPQNSVEARRAFFDGADVPPFEYIPLKQADELLRHCDEITPPVDHPAGALVAQCIEGTRRMVLALQLRTTHAFDEMNRAAEWYPEPALLQLEFQRQSDTQPMNVPVEAMTAQLRDALDARGMHDWQIEVDPVMSARVLVDGAKHLLRVSARARFRERDLTRLVVHEIDVHARRAVNGQQQALRCFETGLPGALATEEGLAMVAEEVTGTAGPGVLARQVEVARAVDHARTAGFREVFTALADRVSKGLAWSITHRVKRGLANPDEPGVYAKDTVYLRGRMLVRQFLDEGGDIAKLYVGKVAVDHPVDEWLAAGWVRPGPVPTIWRQHPA